MSSSQRGFVATRRGALAYRRQGKGAPLVLLQILPFGSVMFEAAMPLLAERGHDCIAFDLMGYAHSDRRSGDWSIADFATNLAEAIDALGVQSFSLLGGHFAGLVAAELCLLRPDQVQRLVLDGVPLWSPEQRQKMATTTPEPPGLEHATDRLNAAWQQFVATLRKLDPTFEPHTSDEAQVLDLFAAFLRATYRPGVTQSFFAYDAMARLASIRHRVLIIGSPADSLVSYFDATVRLMPLAKGHMLGANHPLHQLTRAADPTPWCDAVTNFLVEP